MTSLKKYDWWLLLFVWAAVQLLLVYYLGINSKEESLKYIDVANRWVQGQRSFNWNTLLYSGYVSLHVLLRLVGLPVNSLYIVQLLLSALSTYYFIKTISLFSNKRLVLLFSGLLYASCFLIQEWVTALFTDSVFCSLLIIAIYFLLTETRSRANRIICWFLILILPFFRPVGFLYLLLAAVYWLFLARQRSYLKATICGIGILFFSLVIRQSLESPGYFYPNHILEANVICGYPGNLLVYQKVPYREGMSMVGYLLSNPNMTLHLFVSRFIKIFVMTRNYYSAGHNILLSAASLVYLILGILGTMNLWRTNRQILFFLISGILIFSIPSVVFCQDWSGRFSLPVICFILLLCGFGIDMSVRKLIDNS